MKYTFLWATLVAIGAASPAWAGDATTDGADETLLEEPEEDPFRLRGDIKNLEIPMNEETVQADLILPATISFSENFLTDESIFQIQAVAGWAMGGYDSEGNNPYEFIPFAAVNKRFSDQSVEERIDNTSVGFMFHAILGADSGIRHDVSAQAIYVTDSHARTDIASGKLYWAPYINNTLGVRHSLGENFAEIYFLANAQLHFGEVFDDGGKVSLSDSDEYLRAGTQLYAGLRGNAGSSFEGFEAYAGYLYLYGFGGRYDEIERFEAGANYMFGDLGRYGVGIKYTNGRVDDTLEKADFLEASFLVRF